MIVGVEITCNALRAVCFDQFDAKQTPVKVLDIPLPVRAFRDDAVSDGLSNAIAELARQIENAKTQIAVAVPSEICLFRVASFPYRTDSKVAKTLTYAMEDRLPGSVDDYIIEPVSNLTAVGNSGARVAVAACRVQTIEGILEAFHGAGLDPCVIQPSSVSLVRYVALNEPIGDTDPLLLVRADVSVCELVWLEQGELRACQAIPAGYGEKNALQGMSVLADKIALAIRAYEMSDGSVAVNRLVVVESGDADRALIAALEDRVDLGVAGFRSCPVDGRLAGAWGVAADASTRKHNAPTFRRGQHAYRPFALRFERRIAVMLLLCIAILCMLGIRSIREISRTQRDLTILSKRQDVLFKDMGVVSGTLYEMKTLLGRTRKAAQTADRNRVVSCIERWRALKALAPAAEMMSFEQIDINQTRIRVTVMARNGAVAERFRERIRASETFVPDPIYKMKTVTGKGVSLEMELRYR